MDELSKELGLRMRLNFEMKKVVALTLLSDDDVDEKLFMDCDDFSGFCYWVRGFKWEV